MPPGCCEHDPVTEALCRTPVENVTLGGRVNRGAVRRSHVDTRMGASGARVVEQLADGERADRQRQGPSAAVYRDSTGDRRAARRRAAGRTRLVRVAQRRHLGLGQHLLCGAECDERIGPGRDLDDQRGAMDQPERRRLGLVDDDADAGQPGGGEGPDPYEVLGDPADLGAAAELDPERRRHRVSNRCIPGRHSLPQGIDRCGVVRRVLPEGGRIDPDRRGDTCSQMNCREVDLQHPRSPRGPRHGGDLCRREGGGRGQEKVGVDPVTQRGNHRDRHRGRTLGDRRAGGLGERGTGGKHARARARRDRSQRERRHRRRALVILHRDAGDGADDGQGNGRQARHDRLPAGAPGAREAARRAPSSRRIGRGTLRRHRAGIRGRTRPLSRLSRTRAKGRHPLPPDMKTISPPA